MIYIPSYKRADNCKAAKYLSEAVICCHEFEANEYRRHNANRIAVIPDNLSGKGMAIIRNWILENAESDEILMVDDDVSVIGYFEGKRKIKLDEGQVYQFVDQAFRMCREAGTVLWGLNLLNDKMAYREYSPFSLRSVVLGPFMGIIRCGIRFDARLGLKEDYDYSLQVLNKFRKILRFNKYHYAVGHLVGKGGCTSYRTTGKELEQRESFVRKWGKKIIRFKGKDVNPIINVPIPGI